MRLAPALLEQWMRDYYFDTTVDIGSSGVECFSLGDLRQLIGLKPTDLDRVVFHDSRTLGDPALRRAIADRWGDGDPDKVMATHGSSEAIYLIMNALLEAGDEVVFVAPAYQQLFSIAESIGCKLKPWRLDFDRQFKPDISEAIELIGPRTRMIVVNFPHNPTGVSITRDQQQSLIAAAAKMGSYLVWDAAFADLTYDGPPLPDPGVDYERAISMGTLSKAYGLPGLRVGWCLFARELAERFIRLRDYITLHLSPLVELIAERVIGQADKLLSIRLAQSRANLATLADWVSEHEGLVSWVKPDGGVCAFPRLNAVGDVESFCQRLAHQHSVLLVPGTRFKAPQHVRLGFGGPNAELVEGLARLSGLLKETAGD
jgi:capreomycidine synthase